jgi:PAS domain S-box-containing protein
MAFLWIQNHRRFAGTGLWLAGFILQFVAISLIALRGTVPDFLSIIVSDTLIAGGTILLYAGLEQFVGKAGRQTFNIVILVLFTFLNVYFIFVHPSQNARNILISMFLLAIFSRSAWLLLYQVGPELSSITRIPGLISVGFCLVGIARIYVALNYPAKNDLFRSHPYDTSLVMLFQILTIALTFTIFLMVNRRLVYNLENDILERERVEAALRLSEKREQAFYEKAPDALITVTGEGKITRLNYQARALFGYDDAELLNQSIHKLLPEHLQESHRRHWEEYFENPQVRPMGTGLEIPAARKDGTLFPAEIGLSPLQVSGEMFVTADVRDISERRQMEEKLRESRENFQGYFNMSTVGMCVMSPDMKWIETNGRLRQMLGYTAEELDCLTWKDLSHPDDLDDDLPLFNQVLANQRDSYQMEKRFIRKDGSTVYTTMNVSCYRNPDGSVRYFLSSLVDITEQKQAEAALLQLAAVEERQRLARDLHDSVNQSIHSLVLFSETLVSALERNNLDRVRQLVGRLQESARQALKEARLLLYQTYAPTAERSMDLIQELEMRLATVERRAGVRAHIVREGSMDNIPPSWSENLFWITIEALNNALKHAQARSMKIIFRTSPQQVELEIIDDGRGFDPNRTQAGGMGLQNMRQRANMLHGVLEIFSTPGKGSCVRFKADLKE